MPLIKEAALNVAILAQRLYPLQKIDEIAPTGDPDIPVVVVINGVKVIPTLEALAAEWVIMDAEERAKPVVKTMEQRVAELEARVLALEGGKP